MPARLMAACCVLGMGSLALMAQTGTSSCGRTCRDRGPGRAGQHRASRP